MYGDVSLYILILVQFTFPYKIAEDVYKICRFVPNWASVPRGSICPFLIYDECDISNYIKIVMAWTSSLEFEFDYVLFKA